MHFYVFGSFNVFMHVLKKCFYKSVKTMYFYVFFKFAN